MYKQHLVVIVELEKANIVLAEIAEAKAEVTTIQPFPLQGLPPQATMITFAVEIEDDEEAAFAQLSWLEENIGPNCLVY